MPRLEELTPGSRLEGLVGGGAVTVVQAQWHGTAGAHADLPRRRRARSITSCSTGTTSPGSRSKRLARAWSLRRRRRTSSASPPRRAASSSPTSSIPYLAVTRRTSIRCRTRSRPSTARCCRASRCASCSPTTPAPARRSWPGSDQGADGPRRPRALPDRLPRAASSSSGRTSWREVRPRLRHPHARQIEASRSGQPVRREEPADRSARPAARATRTCRRSSAQTDWDLVVVRRGAQDVGALLRRRGQGDEALPARRAARRAHAPPPADDGDAAQRQGGGLPALHGAARRRPLRGQARASGVHAGRRLRHDAAAGQGGAAALRRASRSSPSAGPTRVDVRALGRRRPRSTTRSPTTCARR